ncbi:MAG: RecQ family ATP-dependent DNA helicase [Ignavibacteria bacterium]|nr:RecQ family ATP-dependent DNA helicase [Ignavibacteria bacterium]
MDARIESARIILQRVFGFDSFRPGQEDIIRAVLQGRDVLGVMPTGGGKSLCYQVPSLVFPACTLVISPLVALMADQVDRLRNRNVQAFALNASMSQAEVSSVIEQAQQGRVKLLYIAPERLESKQFRRSLSTITLSLLAVDEAHCISEWGHDFRAAYRTIPSIFEFKQRVPIVALTATATPDVRDDIVKNLKLRNHIEFVRGFDRPNLSFRVEKTSHKVEFITRESKRDPDSTVLVYAGSRRRVETITEELRKRKLNVSGYHAGRSAVERTLVQDRFLSGKTQILVATNAFGLGVDKADVRHVIHTDLTLSLEAYYQEAGRAGRDGLPSTCTILYQTEDRRLADFLIESTYPEESVVDLVVNYLYQRAMVALGMVAAEPVLADEMSIAADLHIAVGAVKGVFAALERSGALIRTTPKGMSRLRMRSSLQRFHEFVENSPPERKPALDAIDRLLSSASVSAEIEFSLHQFLRKSGISITEFSNTIQSLHVARILRYTTPDAAGAVLLISPNPENGSDLVDMPAIHLRREHAVRKLDMMIRYVETPSCKRNFILTYFNDNEFKGDCGRCSSCMKLPTDSVEEAASEHEIESALIRATSELNGKFGRNVVADVVTGSVSARTLAYKLDRATTWGECSKSTRATVMRVLDHLIEQGLIIRSSGEYPVLGISRKARTKESQLPKALSFESVAKQDSNLDILAALIHLRDEISNREDVGPASLVSLSQLQCLSADMPAKESDLVYGKHGSAIFLARYGNEVVRAIQQALQRRKVPGINIRTDDQTTWVISEVNKGGTVADIARKLNMTPAALAHTLQKALESGVHVERNALVSDAAFERIREFMRHHRYARFRHVREYLQADTISMPEIRIAMAFVRKELYG